MHHAAHERLVEDFTSPPASKPRAAVLDANDLPMPPARTASELFSHVVNMSKRVPDRPRDVPARTHAAHHGLDRAGSRAFIVSALRDADLQSVTSHQRVDLLEDLIPCRAT